MYKLIVNNTIVDVVKKIRYVRYIPDLNKVVITAAASAHGICGSDNKTFYALPDANIPVQKTHWKKVTIIPIEEAEYNHLKSSLANNITLNADYKLVQARNNKIAQLSAACSQAIVDGFTCTLSDGTAHHFRLTIEDQLNLIDLERFIQQGASRVLFHSTNNVCELFDAKDLNIVIETAAKHKQKQTTYFNLLKHCIYNIDDIELIKSVEYGVDLQSLPVSEDISKLIEELL